jgi:hypothetical protein
MTASIKCNVFLAPENIRLSRLAEEKAQKENRAGAKAPTRSIIISFWLYPNY